jgi:hypothetical protein
VSAPLPQQGNAAPGKNLLKIIGIIEIILCSINLFGALFMPDDWYEYESSEYIIMDILTSLYGIFVGIMAVVYCEKLDKAQLLLVLISIDALTGVFYMLYDFYPLSLVLMAVPALWIFGAYKNYQAYKNG